MSKKDTSEEDEGQVKLTKRAMFKKALIWLGSIIMVIAVIFVCADGFMHRKKGLTKQLVGSNWRVQAELRGKDMYPSRPTLEIPSKDTGYMITDSHKTKIPLQITANKHLVLGDGDSSAQMDMRETKSTDNKVMFTPVSETNNGKTQNLPKSAQNIFNFTLTKE